MLTLSRSVHKKLERVLLASFDLKISKSWKPRGSFAAAFVAAPNDAVKSLSNVTDVTRQSAFETETRCSVLEGFDPGFSASHGPNCRQLRTPVTSLGEFWTLWDAMLSSALTLDSPSKSRQEAPQTIAVAPNICEEILGAFIFLQPSPSDAILADKLDSQ